MRHERPHREVAAARLGLGMMAAARARTAAVSASGSRFICSYLLWSISVPMRNWAVARTVRVPTLTAEAGLPATRWAAGVAEAQEEGADGGEQSQQVQDPGPGENEHRRPDVDVRPVAAGCMVQPMMARAASDATAR
jgi:hypothetical protein